MTDFQPQYADYATHTREEFNRQSIMQTIGAELLTVKPGIIAIQLPYQPNLLQQNGFIHAGVLTTIVDSACGFAAFTLMPEDARVLTVEYKVNFLSPAIGDSFLAKGRVTKAGRTITVCHGDVFAYKNQEEKLIATMLATMIQIPNQVSQ